MQEYGYPASTQELLLSKALYPQADGYNAYSRGSGNAVDSYTSLYSSADSGEEYSGKLLELCKRYELMLIILAINQTWT